MSCYNAYMCVLCTPLTDEHIELRMSVQWAWTGRVIQSMLWTPQSALSLLSSVSPGILTGNYRYHLIANTKMYPVGVHVMQIWHVVGVSEKVLR